MAVIETRALTRSYGVRRGVEHVELAVPEGSLFGFLGPNGAGKTTVIRVLMGFLRASGGEARIFGLDCWRDGPRVRAEVGYVPGDLRLYHWMTGESALRIVGAVRGRDIMRHGGELAEQFELDLRVRVRLMSRGMRQKLGLILALAHEPRLLVLDEPTASLDPLMQERLQHRLRALARGGRTVFFSSHSLSEVEQLCDRVAIVREGRIVAQESLEALRKRAGHDVKIVWNDGATPEAAPAFLRVIRCEGREWHAVLEGPIEPLVAWLGGRGLADLSIGPPDLESLFRRFYSGETGERQR
jgi:ABC-2 type transport system ATP-binding protein